MAESLRITVGNDVYFERPGPKQQQRPRSPGGDLRNRLRPRMDPYQRMSDDMIPEYRDRPPDHRSDERGSWKPVDDRRWSPGRPPFNPPHPDGRYPQKDMHRDRYSPSQDRRRMHSPPRDHVYDPELHRRSPRRSPMRRSRSPPRRRSRSPPYHLSSHSRPRRHSSSDSSDSRHGRRSRSRSKRRNRTSDNLPALADDLLLTMYSKRENSGREKDGGYLHPSLDKNTKLQEEKSKKMQYNQRGSDPRPYASATVVSDGHALNALTEAYGNSSPPPKKYDTMDDEERYLYGDGPQASNKYNKRAVPSDSEHRRYHKESPPLQEPRKQETPDEKTSSVTPGGFDTNALKNVLKAIGFDFELSAQSLQKAATAKEPEAKVKPVISATTNMTSTSVQEQVKPQSEPIYQQPYQQVTAQPPVQQPFPTNPYLPPPTDGGLFVYQSQNATPTFPSTSIPQQVMYQPNITPNIYQDAQPVSQPFEQTERPNLKVISTVSPQNEKISRSATSNKSAKTLENERKSRKKKLDYLEVELRKLKKQQAELTKKKKRQLNKGDQELMKQNSLLQEGVQKQIQEIRESAEKAARVKSESEDSDSDESSSDDEEFNYADPGDHFCTECNVSCATLLEFLSHLHSKSHKKLMDPNHKPWYKKVSHKKKSKRATVVPLKGPQFLLPISGYYCELCKNYSGDQTAAEDHCKTEAHNAKYAKYCKKNPAYEKKQRNSAIQSVAERIKKLREDQSSKEKKKQRRGEQKDVDGSNRSPIEDIMRLRKHHSSDRSPKRRDSTPPRPRLASPQKLEQWSPPRPRERSPPRPRERSHPRSRERSSPRQRAWSPPRRRERSPPTREVTPPRLRDRSPPRFHERSHSPSYERSSHRSRSQTPPRRFLDKTPPRRRPSPHDVKRSEIPPIIQEHKRRFVEMSPERKKPKEGKRNPRNQSQWSPGYDDFERNRETEEANHEERKRTAPKPAGMGFAKFTWKKSEKKEDMFGPKEKKGPTKTPDEETKSKFAMKVGKASTNILSRTTRNKSGLTGRVGNFAPHTTVVKSGQKPPPPPPGEPPRIIPSLRRFSDTGPPKNNSKPVLSAKTRNLRSNKQPVELPPVEDPNVTSTSPAHQKEKREPPPPGTEDLFEDNGNSSDASGISMEIASDEEG